MQKVLFKKIVSQTETKSVMFSEEQKTRKMKFSSDLCFSNLRCVSILK